MDKRFICLMSGFIKNDIDITILVIGQKEKKEYLSPISHIKIISLYYQISFKKSLLPILGKLFKCLNYLLRFAKHPHSIDLKKFKII